MAIDIKEIFKSDLDPNSNSWWSQDKVDKINNNFRQLSSGGMVGPMGSQGSFGSSGSIGTKGFRGFQGTFGNQGNQGAVGESPWVITEGTLSKPIHLFPNKQDPEYTTTPLIVGYSNNVGIQPIAYLAPSSSTLKIHAEHWLDPSNSESLVNLKLTTHVLRADGVTETQDLKDSQHRLFSDSSMGGIEVYEEGRPRNSSSGFTRRINLGLNHTYLIRTQAGGIADDSILISSSGTIFKNNIQVNKSVIINGDLYIENAAGVDKVLVSQNPSGEVKWVDKNQVFPGYPIGSIISIPDWVFNGNNFDLQTQYDQGAGSRNPEPIRFTYGRGIIGGQYEGWYLCNGRKWNASAGVNETLVPNMHYTGVSIGSNGDQLSVNQSNQSFIMGGHDIEMQANNKGGSKYDITYITPLYDNDDEDNFVIDRSKGSSTHYINKMVYLVKLPYNNLEWEESTASAPTLLQIALSYGSTSANACGAQQSSLFRWDAPSGINTSSAWCSFNQPYKLYQLTTLTYAPTGWYKFQNPSSNSTVCSRYWDATTGTFSTSVTCPIVSNITLNYGSRIAFLNNGGGSSQLSAEINSTSFLTATEIRVQSTGSLAIAGWYGNGDTSNPVKRYWNGSNFLGDILTHRYCGKLIINPHYRAVYAPTDTIACQNNSVSLGSQLFVGSNSQPQSYMDASSLPSSITLYGTLNWSNTIGAVAGSEALVNVANQAAPGQSIGSSNKVNYITDYTYINSVVNNQTTIKIDNNGNPVSNSGVTC